MKDVHFLRCKKFNKGEDYYYHSEWSNEMKNNKIMINH